MGTVFKMVRYVLVERMEVVDQRPTVLNPRLGRTISADEVVEIRRRLARRTNALDAEIPCASPSTSPTAKIYVDDMSVDGVAPARKRIKLAVLGLALAAIATILAVIALT